ncbi:MAG TPA: glycosyltransferase family 1 protein [Brevundimonas sp.]|jgi:glycosyltransferase involved in cell wall biosynthesis|uniref:glycosyltransferase family 4 protein n=1 Tax=Brevundimonas sp. TaxID=1871086 RepID=UPI002DF383C7|nr:glycosyltransferase family 1 protein [Brevundimonas sp.]
MARICVDGFNIGLRKTTGIGAYGRNLLSALEGMGHETQVLYGPQSKPSKRPLFNEIGLIDAREIREGALDRVTGVFSGRLGRTARAVEPSDDVIWPARGGGRPRARAYWTASRLFTTAQRNFAGQRRTTRLRFAAHPTVGGPDVVHWTTPLPLHATGRANVLTIHDLIPLRLPHVTLDNKRAFFRLCRDAARRADAIAVVSDATRVDVVRLLGVPEDKLVTTWQSVEVPARLRDRTDADVSAELTSAFDLGWKDYWLHWGAIEPKKNLGRVVEAYLTSGSTRPLVVVGGKGWLDEDETALMHAHRSRGKAQRKRIRVFDHLPFSLLVSLIRGARGTVFPSIYEGFGLPVLESMLLDTPVITSNVASLPEVAGDAAIMVDPYDPAAISRAIRDLDADDALADDLVARGRVQAAKFSPAAHRARLQDLYARVL